MSKSPINEAVLSQVLNLMRNGQLRRCAEMGLEPEVLGQIQHPMVMSLLLNSPVSWAKVSIDKEILRKLIAGAARSEDEMRLIERAIRLGATTNLLTQYFGLSPQEVAMQRTVIGVAAPRGRWPELRDDQDHHIWHRWTHLMRQNDVDIQDSMAMLDVAMLVAEELVIEGVTLAQIWNRITSWISQGLYPPSQEMPGPASAAQQHELVLAVEGKPEP
ncbi:DUF2857 domain-containing protein [Azotobacter vinelandii]|uniref:DUF2857 domain-containing protein n=1 Tax=Azotobacter vinelandii TaxID=354 RepID=UPI000915D099|nr:DUF2857 domain-containing protein [Azotobacter vinelandii]WKN23205.1 DUF2857 domain-containing protein [Azotobacter vinelandii]SFY07962.1 Protein of unknown function [Azotobacter vinelandii]